MSIPTDSNQNVDHIVDKLENLQVQIEKISEEMQTLIKIQHMFNASSWGARVPIVRINGFDAVYKDIACKVLLHHYINSFSQRETPSQNT